MHTHAHTHAHTNTHTHTHTHAHALSHDLQHDGEEYIRLLTFCKCVCKFLKKCSDSGIDPFVDICSACTSRIKHYKTSR